MKSRRMNREHTLGITAGPGGRFNTIQLQNLYFELGGENHAWPHLIAVVTECCVHEEP